MSTRVILEIFGWIGSGLIVLSLAQARVWRFRIMNFVGAVIATVYNFLLEIGGIPFMTPYAKPTRAEARAATATGRR